MDDLAFRCADLLESGQIPDDPMPMANDPIGNVIFLAMKGDSCNGVFFGDHELEDPDTGYLLQSLVASSFSEFIENCHISDCG